jgi:prepilin-type N-terminal cleavage/methylation domain-containing protein
MTKQRAHHVRSRQGYSLVELLVAVAIFGVLAAAGLPHIDTRRQDLNTTSKQVVADLRWARTRSITSGVHFAVYFPDTQHYKVQRFQQAANGTWSSAEDVKVVTLPSNLDASVFPTIEFNTRGMMVSSPGSAYLTLYLNDSRYGGSHRVLVWPSGQIYEDA